MHTGQAYREAFDRLFDRGREAVLAGTHYRDSPPVDNGRWGISVVLRPDQATATRLHTITREAMAVAGPDHWPTGQPQAIHFTVRALEAHRRTVPDGDPRVGRYCAALRHAATRSRPVKLAIGGLTLTPSGVMACATPIDNAAAEFSAALREHLGPDRWFEENFNRSIWYATLVHFAGPIAHSRALVDWVAGRRDLNLGPAEFAAAQLVRFRYNGRQPIAATLATAALTGSDANPTSHWPGTVAR